LYSDLRVQQNFGALQNAYGSILATLGTDPLPEEIGGHDVATLSKAMELADHRSLDAIVGANSSVKNSR
ncbi:MAG: hypothetical protein P4L91_20105, partial [Burkholderiaceae bacterium]|nr:hypothetical protein [Burkholderiaceae bacterium]